VVRPTYSIPGGRRGSTETERWRLDPGVAGRISQRPFIEAHSKHRKRRSEMKRAWVLCLVACVLSGLIAQAKTEEVVITTYVDAEVFALDGTFLFYADYGLLTASARLTGKVTHYGDLTGKGHIINDGQGRERGQEFGVDPFYGILPHRWRYSGTMELILFGDGTATMEGSCPVWHDVFGTAEEVLPLYPWAAPRGSENGQGWWCIGIEYQTYYAVYP
jgi:hypothetical protein